MSNACLFSGGKDSTLALHRAMGLGIKIDLLITMESKNQHSFMFHYPNTGITALQAESMGIRQAFFSTEGRKEEELLDLEKAFTSNNVRVLVTGATYSRYQSERINSIASRLGIESVAPLWHIDPYEELNTLSRDYEAIITSVSAEGMDESLLGRRIDDGLIKKLAELNRHYGINMLFEGGEAESFVLDAPLFSRRILVRSARKAWEGTYGTYIIEDAVLAGKKPEAAES